MKLNLVSHSADETIRAGRNFAQHLDAGDVVCLDGDLGAGKTHFVKGVASYFGIEPDKVNSPTFTLIHEYSGSLPVYHFDCYRLKSEQEAIEIGTEEYLFGEGISLVEWPKKIRELLPKEAIWIKISHLSGDKRKIELQEQE